MDSFMVVLLFFLVLVRLLDGLVFVARAIWRWFLNKS